MSLVRVLAAGELEPGSLRAVDVPDAAGTLLPVVVVRDEDGGYHALADECSHQAVLLSDGEDDAVEGCALECWLHGSRFDLRTGAPSGLPATRPVPVYRLELDGDDVLVDVEARADGATTTTTPGAPAGAPAKES